ncbi:MAG: alanine--tRNA ligase [Clostridiaceae bacterium]|jgi:alanyl-tRNA synthetase|nr:alanine--tRNA ligase [Clostridiaceae bacterium]
MKKLNSAQLRAAYLEYFKSRGHAVINTASLIPENDPTVLFTTAGMHPLVPYLLGQKHPASTRLTDVQICARTGDIDEVGDASHCTFFEMLGNWSLGDYFKKESISWSFGFLTEALGIDVKRIAVSVFAGDENCKRDDESAKIWKSLGIPSSAIFFLPKENNWWGLAGQGPCGPDTEIFIDTGKKKCGPDCSPACNCGKYLEIWNNVFMQYFKDANGKLTPLEKPNVDTGMGLERTVCILNGFKSVYETDLFADAVHKIEELCNRRADADALTQRSVRIVADHIRTAVFMLGDVKGVTPSNVYQGYVLRRLLRRAIRFGRFIDLPNGALQTVAAIYIEKYKDVYPFIAENAEKIISELVKEEEKFAKTLVQGVKEFEKLVKYIPDKKINGKSAFRLYDTYGFPLEMTVEMAEEVGFSVDTVGFAAALEEHQNKSRVGAEQAFKGGLADSSETTANLHSATHMLHEALRRVLGGEIKQRGSNITAERSRFDFEFGRPLTPEEIQTVENLVNGEIKKALPVICAETSVDEAKSSGAIGVFDNKYDERVKVYTVGFSKEICGGPHAANTGDLGTFSIQKEQSSSAGVRRIYSVLK